MSEVSTWLVTVSAVLGALLSLSSALHLRPLVLRLVAKWRGNTPPQSPTQPASLDAELSLGQQV